jgi:hypothetical protein
MKNALRGVIVGLVAVGLLWSAVGAVRWARRGGTAASLAASALMLALGMGVVVDPPQRGVAQAEEEADKSGGESGDPPSV